MKKKRVLAAVTAAAVLAMPFVGVSAEETEENYWFLQGYEDGELHLERTLTRAEFAKMIAEAFQLQETEEKPFVDLDAAHWSYPYVMKVVKAGAIHGFEDGSFRPEEKITLEQAAKITSGLVKNTWNLQLAKGVATAIEFGLMDGIQALIGDEITRGDAAKMIARALEVKAETGNAWAGNMGSGSSGGGSAPAGAIDKAEGTLGFEVDGNREYHSGNEEEASEALGGSVGRPPVVHDAEEYAAEEENIFKDVKTSPLSTFSIDTDTASYSNMRRFILSGQFPPKGSIRTEELINYFDYDYPLPKAGEVFGVSAEVGKCPWNEENNLVKIAVQGEEMSKEERLPSNLVFLVDVSGSMYSSNKLPLVKKALKMLVDTLDERDYISVVIYANGVEVVLDSTNASEKEKIYTAIDSLSASGGTNGGDGLKMAYRQAEKNLLEGNNRVIICSDGDFNIGITSQNQVKSLIQQEKERGIFITALGFGMYNYKDTTMETIADKGNGNYAYIDNLKEAKKVLVDEMTQTLYTIAKDVKIQVEFNPEKVKSYRLIGYENRMLQTEDFANDQKDAGELGAGANVTALYEIVPADGAAKNETRYTETTTTGSDELLCVNVRYKEPGEEESKLVTYPVQAKAENAVSADFHFVSALAELGMLLNTSEYAGDATLASVMELAQKGRGADVYGLKNECIQLVDLLRYIRSENGK